MVELLSDASACAYRLGRGPNLAHALQSGAYYSYNRLDSYSLRENSLTLARSLSSAVQLSLVYSTFQSVAAQYACLSTQHRTNSSSLDWPTIVS